MPGYRQAVICTEVYTGVNRTVGTVVESGCGIRSLSRSLFLMCG